jgi:hypothetical protein
VSDEALASHATLRVFGANLDPAEVSAFVGLEPTHSHRAGDARTGGAAPNREGLWALSTKGLVESPDLDEHLRYLVGRVSSVRESLEAVLRRANHRGDVFCYLLRETGHGGPTVAPEVMTGFGELGLSLGLDIYGPFNPSPRHRSVDEIWARSQSRLNAALRRPGMYGGQVVLVEMLLDLAWADRKEEELVRWGARLVERSMWTSTGVVGAFERLVPGLNAENGATSVFADIALSLHWLELDGDLAAPDYWRMRNDSERLIAGTDIAVEGIVELYGEPVISIGGSRGRALGYVDSSGNHPIIWFYESNADDSIACRRVGSSSFADDVLFTPSGLSLRDPETYPSEVLRGVPQPFRPDWFQVVGVSAVARPDLRR